MKVIIDTKTNEVKIGGKHYIDAAPYIKDLANNCMRQALIDNSKLSDYEEDCMWMSYRYCIGRHTIAANMHASDIWQNCKGRISKDRQLFTAFDINRSIEDCLRFYTPSFHFPLTSYNRIYTSAIDIVLQFMIDYNVKSNEDLLKYRDINVILTDNEQGYKIEIVTWEEWLRPQVLKICQDFWNNDAMSEDFAWKLFIRWQNKEDLGNDVVPKMFESLTKDMPNAQYYSFINNIEDLMVWNDLVHCFDYEHHHKSILKDDREVEWFWGWNDNVEEREPGKFYKTFGYHRVRIPVNKWNGDYSPYIPDESIKENIY